MPLQFEERADLAYSAMGLDSAIQIGQQIFLVFNPHRNAHQVFWQVTLRHQLRRYAGVRHISGHADRGVDAAKTDGNAKQLGVFRNRFRERDGTSREAEHCARTTRLRMLQLVSRIAFQPRITDLFY